MQLYVVVDMEGISGIVNIRQVDITEPAFAEGREMLAADVNATVAGASHMSVWRHKWNHLTELLAPTLETSSDSGRRSRQHGLRSIGISQD